MIAGHFGFAAAVKAKAPAVPLWSLMLACQWLDVIFVPLLMSGVERLVPIDGVKEPGYGQVIIYADYTHSLLGAAVLAMLFGVVAAIRYGKTSGLVLAGVVLSHWVLDLFMHRDDMPFLPGNAGTLAARRLRFVALAHRVRPARRHARRRWSLFCTGARRVGSRLETPPKPSAPTCAARSCSAAAS